jgi:hypothetical protein
VEEAAGIVAKLSAATVDANLKYNYIENFEGV